VSSFSIHPIDPNEIAAILHGSHSDPFRVLGPHSAGDDLVIRIFRPEAKQVSVVATNDHGQEFPADRLHVEGLYQATVPNKSHNFSYLVKVTGFDGDPPKSRVVIHVWDSLEQIQAWYNSPEYKEARKIGEKYAKFRSFAVDGVPQ